jgi:L-2-hydroxyglutarate oxidase LhgO
MTDSYVTIIGGGVVGNAIAYELSKTIDDEIVHLEKNKHFPGENQTSRNSGVIHAGIYYDKQQSPLKAKLCVEGNELLYQFCKEHQIPSNKTGKLIVATNQIEDNTLDLLLLNSINNEISGVEKIDGEQVREMEPNIKAYSALKVPSSGIIDPISLVHKLKDLANLKEYFLVGTKILNITAKTDEFIVKASTESEVYEFTSKYIINAAGLYSDEIARLVNPKFPLKIFPVRGETAKFYQTRKDLTVSRNIYPTPLYYEKPDQSKHLTVGIHLTPTFSINDDRQTKNDFQLGKEITVGPLNRKRGDMIGKEDFGSDLANPDKFLEKIRTYFPAIKLDDLQLHQTGIQAVIANSHDFHIAPDLIHPRMINLVGICSPGLTSSLAIAKMTKKLIK